MTEEKKPPDWMDKSIVYMCTTGSVAYGYNLPNSDLDIFGVCVPPEYIVFPHMQGVIPGFTSSWEKFDQFALHNIVDVKSKKEYDFTVFSIVKFFRLALDGNPNVLETLFVTDEFVHISDEVGDLIRKNKYMFLSMEMYPKYLGFAKSELKKFNKEKGNLKCAARALQRLLQLEQFMISGDLNTNKESAILLSAIRSGKFSYYDITLMGSQTEARIAAQKNKSVLPANTSEYNVRKLLVNCLEIFYAKNS